MDLLQLIANSGPVMWVLTAGGLAVLAIFLYKTFQFHRDEVNVGELIKGLTNVLSRDGYVEALTLCDHTPGPAARVLASVILAAERGDEDLEKAVEDAGLEEIPKLESMTAFIGTVGYVSPLLGLLGTVLGMMTSFEQINAAQNILISPEKLMPGVNMALVTTAAGLILGICCYIAYNYLVSRIDHIALDMEKGANELVSFLKHRDNAR